MKAWVSSARPNGELGVIYERMTLRGYGLPVPTFPGERSAGDIELCPVSDEIVARLRQALPSDTAEIFGILRPLPNSERAQLAVFCYRRQHLHELGLTIASTCERSGLVGAAGASGNIIYEQSRNPARMLGSKMGALADQRVSAVTLGSL